MPQGPQQHTRQIPWQLSMYLFPGTLGQGHEGASVIVRSHHIPNVGALRGYHHEVRRESVAGAHWPHPQMTNQTLVCDQPPRLPGESLARCLEHILSGQYWFGWNAQAILTIRIPTCEQSPTSLAHHQYDHRLRSRSRMAQSSFRMANHSGQHWGVRCRPFTGTISRAPHSQSWRQAFCFSFFLRLSHPRPFLADLCLHPLAQRRIIRQHLTFHWIT